MQNLSRISDLLIDLEGVLYSDNKLIKGAVEAINTIRKNNSKIRFLTNTTTAPVKQILEKLKNFNWVILDNAFKLINENKCRLIALHKNKYCKRDGRISLDLGPFVDAIEYACGIKAEVMGKPEKNFFNMAIEDMGVPKNEVVMIGDDIFSDIAGANLNEILAIQVKTGKYQSQDELQENIQPDFRIDSIVDLPNIVYN